MSLKFAKLVLVVVVACFALATAGLSVLISERQDALRQVSRYNIAWLASQAVSEFTRLEQRLSAVQANNGGVDRDEIELRFDILLSRLKLLNDGEFQEFIRHDPERWAVVQRFGEALHAIAPLLDRIEEPGTAHAALAVLTPLDGQLTWLASAANRAGADRAAEDQHELARLHGRFSLLMVGLVGCGVALILLLGWHNRLLERARAELHITTADLTRTSGQLVERNAILQAREGELRAQNERFDAALNNMSHGLCMVDRDGRLIVCNDRFTELFDLVGLVAPGVELEDLLVKAETAKRPGAIALRQIGAEQREAIEECRRLDLIHTRADGSTIAISHQPLRTGGWVAIYEDITERRQAESQIAYMAHHDALTDLANRVLFRERLSGALARARRQGGGVAVLCLDLDRFKDVNDTLGHHTGDLLLKAAAERLRACVRAEDVVARLGGDEFAVLQVGAVQPSECGALASRLVSSLKEPFFLEGQEVVVGASIGIALTLDGLENTDCDGLLKQADIALYRVKADGRGAFRFFEAGMDAQLQARRALERDMRAAFANSDFELHYQPQVDLELGEISGFEALLRWRHPDRGMVSPADFIPVAEDIGLITPLGDWIIRQACSEAATWPTRAKVAVNLSPVQFRNRQLVSGIMAALAQSVLAPDRLELEITESALLDDNEATLSTLHQLRSLGVRIAMDDFGTGYSSPSYLRKFPFDKIKIDQSFVREMEVRANCLPIVQAITGLGLSLGMVITAEGVETEEQLALLQSAGCREAQGYLFGRPKPACELVHSIRERWHSIIEAA